jgi:hypothetical protein
LTKHLRSRRPADLSRLEGRRSTFSKTVVERLRRRLETRLWEWWPRRVRRVRSSEPSHRQIARYAAMLNQEERRLAGKVSADKRHLHRFERSVYSQNGEDGILAEIFARIGTTSREFIEIGASDGTENCTTALVEQGWSGVWVEGDAAKVMAARLLVGPRRVTVAEAFVDRESILPVLKKAGAFAQPDLLVVDIDGNDYWIWETVALRHRPRVVVIEYNALVGPRLHWVLPYNASHRWDETRRHGAGLAALASLGSRLGYTLVGCDSQGVNAFFVVTSESAPFGYRSVGDLYVGPRYGLPYGHPRSPSQPFDSSEVPGDERGLVRLRVDPPDYTHVRPGGLVYAAAAADNGTSVALGSSRSTPTNLAAWWLDDKGDRLVGEPERSVQRWRADPGTTAYLVGRATAPAIPGRYTLVFGLVQESVCWFDGPTQTTTAGMWDII